ncbi:hypothetical protein LTR10_022561 [Elasticomyces elasticus]|uniref:Phenylacetaldoxime dehydratase n=1 Tax=Exophiala sideris TaxID=1016849 RepID=A0ABR0J666_9EURO|nr:hypothetical protein LTR10_022561 [Elasticomyces elasticus]KAK5023528.1 hypothetical protein LTR13_011169 [Exophiala sideris]KAK5028664.1 hypothetical protein LTS07_006043 [Exophiala sideris]KAK5057168.1 hypothetical protein LTR69_007207 [Exophiala sideris]KAK5181859.1 hypothetical protein LTR44_006059 [Eurotiomycetes sp. CCFEE 6388]
MESPGNGKRVYPLQRPVGHKVLNPRWTVKFPEEVKYVCTLYMSIQLHENDQTVRAIAEQNVEQLLNEAGPNAPATIEVYWVTAGSDVVTSRVWIAHWTRVEAFCAKIKQFDFLRTWHDLGPSKARIGLWREQFPGLARLPNVSQAAHDTTEYWGAGRDRIKLSSHDLFETSSELGKLAVYPKGFAQRLTGFNYDNMCHIRSGQYWELCSNQEREAYETDLQKKLMKGMQYLWEHPEETGTIGLRFGRKVDEDGRLLRETSAMGFHRNWADLEQWSSRHPSHLAIFTGAMKHNKRFGDARRFMTWQEVSILKAGEAKFLHQLQPKDWSHPVGEPSKRTIVEPEWK